MSVRVAHVITTLDLAGAQLLLHRLVSKLDPAEVTGEVISLGPSGPAARLLEEAGWPVTALDMAPGRVRPRDLVRLACELRRIDPDVVHTWMYHADLLGGVVARLTTRSRVMWSLHQSALPAADMKRSTRAIARVNALLSWLVPRTIVSTSWSARAFHTRLGYRPSRIHVIPTSFDLPGPINRQAVRAGLEIPPAALVVARVGRFHAQKDYPTFLRAMDLVLAERDDVHVVLAGAGVTADNAALPLPQDAARRARVHLLGERPDAPLLVAACDVAVSSSAFGESTALVIGEAMAAGVPVVTTDVGDAARLVGRTGRVVPPREPAALAAATRELLELDPEERAALGAAARKRIREYFSLDVMAARYETLYGRAGAQWHLRLIRPRLRRPDIP
jgi:glycosyltransferase involved in cell wall biosynthesis